MNRNLIITTASLTGHRPKLLPWGYDETKESCIKFKEDLRKILIETINSGLTTYLTGMAEGFDMIGTEILLELKKSYKIKVISVIPCLNQESKWSKNQQERYINIKKQCDECIVLSEEYTQNCMNERNKYMVEHSSVVIGCYNGEAGGTQNTLRFAKEKGCKIKIINPDDYKNKP